MEGRGDEGNGEEGREGRGEEGKEEEGEDGKGREGNERVGQWRGIATRCYSGQPCYYSHNKLSTHNSIRIYFVGNLVTAAPPKYSSAIRL